MLRGAIWLFALVIAGLVLLSLQPAGQAVLPDANVLLRDADVVLYPRADEGAVWLFHSPVVSYSPASGRSVLQKLSDGRRTVGGETDFRLAADELLIDRDDNLSGDQLTVRLERTGECLTMLSDGTTPVVIEQGTGLFRVPLLDIQGPAWGSDNRWQRVTVSFDLEEFSAGGPGTVTINEFLAGAGQDPGRNACDF